MQPEGKRRLPVVRGLETHCRKNSARAVGKGLLREPTGDLGTSSSSLAGEHFIELSGKGVSISQEASGSSHQAPSEHKSASGFAQHPGSPPTIASPRAHLLLCRIQPCARHMLPWYHLPAIRKDDKTIITFHPRDRAVGCEDGTQLSWLDTITLSTAQSSLKQRVRAQEVKAHPGCLSLRQGGWSSAPLEVSTPKSPEAEQLSEVSVPQWQP